MSNAEFDHQKQGIYAEAGVQEYWIILPEEKQVEVYTRPLGREYSRRRLYTSTEVLVAEAVPGFQLHLSTFFPG